MIRQIHLLITFVTETKDGKDSVIKEITPDNYQTILSGKDNWDKLTDNEKTVINNKLKEKRCRCIL